MPFPRDAMVAKCFNAWNALKDCAISKQDVYRCSQDFLGGGGQTANHMQNAIRNFRKAKLFMGQRYRRMGGQKPGPWFGM